MGSKARLAKYMLPIVLENRKPDQYYVEPFVGGFNLIDKVDGPRIGADNNPYVIAMFQALLNGWNPPEHFTKEQYRHIRDNKDKYPPELVGFIGTGCCFGGRWFEGLAVGGFKTNGEPRNHILENKTTLLKQIKSLNGVEIFCCDYRDLQIPANSIIYCDPPYVNSKKYSTKFNHEEFWQWCREKTQQGHSVYISEFVAPNDFKCVWEMERKTSLSRETHGEWQATEKLFVKQDKM